MSESEIYFHIYFGAVSEISLKEFAQFIGKEMRLSKVEYAPRAGCRPIFNLYMGKNTPKRDHMRTLHGLSVNVV
jgi:hypothetical protein